MAAILPKAAAKLELRKMAACDPKETLVSATENQRAILLKPTNWKTVAEFVGISAIIGSLVFVGLQLRQEQTIAIVDTYGSITESNEAALALISAHPDIWEKGLLGDELSVSDEIVFSGMVRAVMSHFQHMVIRFNRIGPLDYDRLLHNFAYAIYIFPGLRRQWEADNGFLDHRRAAQNRPVGDPNFRPRISQHLSNFDNLQPSIPTKKQFIFWYF